MLMSATPIASEPASISVAAAPEMAGNLLSLFPELGACGPAQQSTSAASFPNKIRSHHEIFSTPSKTISDLFPKLHATGIAIQGSYNSYHKLKLVLIIGRTKIVVYQY